MTWNRAVILAAVPVAGVAVIAGVVSYGHVEALALAQHQTIAQARLLPFAVDFLIVAGSVILLAGSALGWLGVVAGVVATLFANIESGIPYGPLSATVAAWPAIAFTVASFTLERWLKSQVGQGGQRGQEWPAGASATDIYAAEPEPVPATVAICGHEGGRTREEVVVNAYLHGRDCLGEPPSQRHLSATYGLHRTKVAALVGHLNGRHLQDPGEVPQEN